MDRLCIIFWDQLSLDLSSLKVIDKKNDTILMFELKEQCTYVKHHKKKLVFLLSAMRHFAKELIKKGYKLNYVKLDDPNNTQTLAGEVKRIAKKIKVKKIITTLPGDYYLYQSLLKLKSTFDIEIFEDDRFLSSRQEFSEWAKNKKSLRMEFFYREMRKKYQILVQNDLPEGGKWNYDSENRGFPKNKLTIPPHYKSSTDKITKDVIKLVEKNFPEHFGDIEPFYFAVTRSSALQALELFIQERLPVFGNYQDVMIQGQPWLFHSHISMYINAGLLSPLECIKAAEDEFYNNNVPLNSAEGFIRQILGWREFVRGIYWLKMPAYKSENYLKAKRKLPAFYWTANTEMNCVKQCITETKENAYAHHIQRLMVLGNFALLAGINPNAVNEWYLIVYADAHEWVELPNVTGMILFADGGYLASKPYAASGAYIHKMSNYCENCSYNVKLKKGADACPFNYLYWNFLLEHKNLLKKNHRLAMIYASLSRMSQAKIKQIRADSKSFLNSLPYGWEKATD